MKVVALFGSPRKDSNSQKLAEEAIAALPQDGLELKKYRLNDLSYRGCQSCQACKGKSETCVLKDDLTQVLADVAETDVLILSSPVYMGEVTAQLKGFIDRAFCYYTPDYVINPSPSRLAPGKKMLFILTQGMPDRNTYEGPVLGHYKFFFKRLGFDFHTFIAPGQRTADLAVVGDDLVAQVKKEAAALAG